MLNPNICKLVTVDVLADNAGIAVYRGHTLDIHLRNKTSIKPGRRRLWLKYSIMRDTYYLTDRA